MKEYSFYEIQIGKKLNICIPNIQRDYVQGRDNFKNKTNLKKFVKVLIDALVNNNPTSLNFVYGYYGNSKFIPIDGQQRLTTLYLLHLFVFSIAEDDTLKDDHFALKYDIRPSSSRFFSSLLINAKKGEVFTNNGFIDEKPIAKLFKNLEPKSFEDEKNNLMIFLRHCQLVKERWFRINWLNDLTVRSSIIALYIIKEAFKEFNLEFDKATFEKYADILKSDTCPIKFSFMPIKDTSLANDTYVKMNARGKQLTNFENMKVDIFDFLDKNTNLTFNTNEFKKRIDSEWLEICLKAIIQSDNLSDFSSNPEEDKLSKIDDFIQIIFHIVMLNRLVIKDDKIFSDENSGWHVEPSKINFNEHYLNITENGTTLYNEDDIYTALFDFYSLMSLLENKKIFKKQNDKFNIIGDLFSNDKLIITYPNRTLIYAMTKYAKDTVSLNDDDRAKHFYEFIRVIRHVILHSEIDKPVKFKAALEGIDSLNCQWLSDFYGSIKELNDTFLPPPFNKEQCMDEIRKAKKRHNNKDWEDAIFESENHKYFYGQSIFLNTSKQITSSEYNEYWNMLKSQILPDIDSKYSDTLKPIYSVYKLIEMDNIHSARHQTSYTYGYNDSLHHTYDIRGMLEKRDYVDVLIDICNDAKAEVSFENFKNSKISQFSMPSNTNSDEFLKFVLSRGFELERLFVQGRYVKNSGDYRLLKNKSASSSFSLNLGITYLLFKYSDKFGLHIDDENVKINFSDDSIEFSSKNIKIKYCGNDLFNYNDETTLYNFNDIILKLDNL